MFDYMSQWRKVGLLNEIIKNILSDCPSLREFKIDPYGKKVEVKPSDQNDLYLMDQLSKNQKKESRETYVVRNTRGSED